jgi:hypothetical protein
MQFSLHLMIRLEKPTIVPSFDNLWMEGVDHNPQNTLRGIVTHYRRVRLI